MRSASKIPSLLFLHLCVSLDLFSLAHAADFQAKVIHITDGDTFRVLTEKKEQIKIRLNGIDCPEKGQAFGNKAKEFTKNLVAGEMVTIQTYGEDRYGRPLGDVILAEGRDLNQELIKAGLAWWFFKYSDDEQLGILEVKAKIAKVGLWTDPNPIPPWIFRHPGKLDIPLARPPPEAPLGLTTPSAPSSSLPVLGNRRSHKYHRPDCPNYDDIAKRNQVPFESAKRAEEAGFALAGNCPH